MNLRKLLGRRLLKGVITMAVFGGVIIPANEPAIAFAANQVHEYQINQPDYIAQNGHWSILPVPTEFRVNAIHAALLHTGKVLIVAGSGNNRDNFNAGTFKSLLWDPATDQFKLIPTPADMFCAGHAFLPNGNLLVAGGTQRYEKLKADVTHAGGTMRIKNESPEGGARTFPKGTELVSPTGIVFRTSVDVTLPPAVKIDHGNGNVMIHASEVNVWVDAVNEGAGSTITEPAQYSIRGLTGIDEHNLYGLGEKFILDKQDFQGLNDSFEFNPDTERYERVGYMNEKRWYPTLVGLDNGNVLSVSGLDGSGNILNGQNEIYNTATKTWEAKPELNRYFPTYPALFLTADSRLFYSGSSTGYGPEDKGRKPGFWNLKDNSFQEAPGLRDATITETSSSLLLAPAQDQRVMIVGGGGVGESPKATARTDIIDLDAPEPRFTAGPDLAAPTRYASTVILPDDTVLVTGGARDYRGKGDSNNLLANLYHPDTNTLTRVADPTVGRNYHSEALLLPDGRVITLGSDSLFGDKLGTTPGVFEQRIEIFSPPYLFRAGGRASLSDGPATVQRGTTARFSSPDPSQIESARLMRPSAVTHVTDVEQRSIAVDVIHNKDSVDLMIPVGNALVPAGWYMLFVTNHDGTPSVARWVQVV